MTNIVINGRGTVTTNESQAEVERQIAYPSNMEGAPPCGWVRLQPSGTIVNVLHIVSVSGSE